MFILKTFCIFGLVVVLSGCGSGDEEQSSLDEGQWPPRRSEFLNATTYYGKLRIQEGQFEAEAKNKPWSSWWFPTRETYLFRGTAERAAPLEKYDRYLLKTAGKAGRAAEFEREQLYDPNANTWEGLCNAWAVASVREPEPSRSLTAGGLVFDVGDLKALLVKSYERTEGLKFFGQRFNGDRIGVHGDMYPDQFHRVLQAELMAQQKAIIMDKDPGVAVWNTPVWKVQMDIRFDKKDASVAHVRSWVFGASPFVDSYDYVGTLSVVFEYTYDLYGERLANGSFEVSYGDWTGISRDFHPDFITIVPEESAHSTLNKNLDIGIVRQILHGK